MDIFWDLLQEDELEKQKAKASTLQGRVLQLEQEADATKVLLKKALIAHEK